MTTLTVRIDEGLKNEAFKQASVLGIPLTLIVITALKNFINEPMLVIGKPMTVKVTPDIQKKMDKIGKVLSKK